MADNNTNDSNNTTKHVSIYTKIANVILFILFCIIVGYLGYWIYDKVFAVSNEALPSTEVLASTTTSDVAVTTSDVKNLTEATNNVLTNTNAVVVPPKPVENIRLDVLPVDNLPESTNVDAVQRSLEDILSKIKK